MQLTPRKINQCILYLIFAGRFDFNLHSYSCSGCGAQFSPLSLERILNEGYWPGSPKNLNYVFSAGVFKLWDSIRKQMPGTSEAAFLKSIGSISSEKGRVSTTDSDNVHSRILLDSKL